ncbi:MAG: 16S rRNA (guanine(527)-N(7))-methyltransferase RsmG [Gammaproteobacteria bacterium]|nr:16S rRNA (guanine(527)-N(7))-methyltransferase RsmG [Gammaproteobacteria bacterium]
MVESSPVELPVGDAQREAAELLAGARELGVNLEPAQLAALSRLLDALLAANAQFNLTAIRDRPGMLRKHLLDSLSVLPFLRGPRVADVGTGAGFPGLPLAIAAPAHSFVLIEATGKKARYVASTARSLGLANVEVVNERAERYRPQAPFDTVVARAVASLEDLVAYAGHLCAAEGRLLAMKGKHPEREQLQLPKGFRVLAVHRLRVPGLDEERHLVEICRARSRPSAA